MSSYIGRFAPSPTGPLHMGSLYTAVASYLDARANHGQWLLRIEDLDPPREQEGATQAIIQSLQAHGLQWDGDIIYQSDRHAIYDKAIQQLLACRQAFYCECSRQTLADWPDAYPGFCRLQYTKPDHPCAIRLKTDHPPHAFTDRLLGEQQPPSLAEGVFHDFVIYRKDGFYAYQLAVVVDDIEQHVTHIVRGSDILDSTFKQQYLYEYFNHQEPIYLHLPVLARDGQKLSKQNLAPAIDDKKPCDNLMKVLSWLNQPSPPPDKQVSPEILLEWATQHWDTARISKAMAIQTG